MDDLALIRRELGLFQENRGIQVDQRIALGLQHGPDLLQQLHAVCAPVGRVCIREKLADIPLAGRAQQGIDDGMGQHIRIRMAIQAEAALDAHAGQQKRPALL